MVDSPVTKHTAHAPRSTAPSAAAQAGRLLGAVGAVLLLSAPLTYLLADTGPLLGFKVLAGFVGVVSYCATNRDFLRRGRGGRSNTLFAVSALTSCLVLGLVVGLNVLVARHDREWDCTREKIFTLSPQTTELLARLQQPVEVYAFYGSQEPSYPVTEETLHRYAKHSSLVEVHMVDPQSRPDLVKKYNITERGARIVLVTAGRDARAKQASEEELTEALLKVVESSSKTVAFLVGHGEGDTTQTDEAEGFAALAEAIVADGYKVDTLNLQTLVPEGGNDAEPMPGAAAIQDAKPLEIPANVDVLAVLAPVHKLLLPEVQAIAAFLERGGRLLAMEEARGSSGLAPLLADYHVDVRDDMVVDTNPIGRLLGLGVASPLIGPTESNHPILRGLSGAIMSTARSLSEVPGKVANVSVTPLMQTGETAWGETQLAQGSTIARDANDHLPPLYTAMAAQVMAPPPSPADANGKPAAAAATARLVVFGDSDWASNKLLRLQSNEDMALNALGWLTEQEAKVTVRPNVRAQSQLYLTGEQLAALKFLSMDIVPVLLVAFGLGIVLLRRQR